MRFKDDAVGSLTHTVLLHEAAYHTVFEIMADGLHILIEDPYSQPTVTVRKPHSNIYESVRSLLPKPKIRCLSKQAGNLARFCMWMKGSMRVARKAIYRCVILKKGALGRSLLTTILMSRSLHHWAVEPSGLPQICRMHQGFTQLYVSSGLPRDLQELGN